MLSPQKYHIIGKYTNRCHAVPQVHQGYLSKIRLPDMTAFMQGIIQERLIFSIFTLYST